MAIANQVMSVLADKLPNGVETHAIENIALFKAKNMFTGPFCLDFYTFILPYTQLPDISVEHKIYTTEYGKIFPVNPYQMLGASDKEVDYFISISVSKNYLQEIYKAMFGKKELYFRNHNFTISSELSSLIKIFMHESQSNMVGRDVMLSSLSMEIAICLVRELNSNVVQDISGQSYNDRSGIKRVIDYMQENLNRGFSFSDISKVANYSPYYFIRIFKSETGKSPYEYLLELRMQKAKDLLEDNNHTITEICFMCGFNNPSHFTLSFKKRSGVTPTAYRKMHECI